ncbi:MAG: GAF domain-containing protein [Dechloromonas sp.]|nr:MAG: GAF domain-containing protein [Dechloromonas sp.]
MKNRQISANARNREAGNFSLLQSGREDKSISGTALGKLTSTSVSPLAAAGEIIFLPLIAVVLGFAINPEDPLWIEASFPWAWFAPVILALRYGPLAGLGGAGLLLVAWLLINVGHYDAFPKLPFLGGLILVMLVGEFSSLWLARTRRAETIQIYLDQRLEHLTRQYYLLRLSHDRLEQDLISRPMSMRDALHTLRGLGSGNDGGEQSAQTLLRLLSQYCQLESASLHRVIEGKPVSQPLATIGTTTALNGDDPLIQQALDTLALCHISQAQAEQQTQTRYLIAAPLINLNGDLYGLLTVEEIPFFSLQDETLQTINLLLGYYTDGLAVHALAEPVCEALPLCPPEFAFEVQRLHHLRQTTGIGSMIVALEFLPKAVEQDLPLQMMRMKRSLDEHWLIPAGDRQILATLMPLGDTSTGEGYLARLEAWAQQKSGKSLAEIGVFPHILPLNAEDPIPVLKRTQGLTHG